MKKLKLNELAEDRNTVVRQFDYTKKHNDLDVVIDPVTADAIENSKQNIKAASKALAANIKAAEDLARYNEKEGPGKTEIEKMKFELNESLFEAVEAKSNVDYILKALDNVRNELDSEDVVPTRKDFKAAFKQFLKNADLDEELSQERQWDFNSDFYNAIADVCFKYRDENITEDDLDTAWDWFMIHFNDNDLFEESLTEDSSQQVTVGIYGDEVDGFLSVDLLVKHFEKQGIIVSDVDGDMDFGWEMNLTAAPRTLFFAVCTTVPGYNCDSVSDFIDQYSIDDSDRLDEAKEPDITKFQVIARNADEDVVARAESATKKTLLKKINSFKALDDATTIEVEAPKGFKDVCYFAIRDSKDDPWEEDVNELDLAIALNAFDDGIVEAIYNELTQNPDPADRHLWLVDAKISDRFDTEKTDETEVDITDAGKIKIKFRKGREEKDKEFVQKVADTYKAGVTFNNNGATITYKDNI